MCYKSSLNNINIVTTKPDDELEDVSIPHEDYLIQINRDYVITNKKNKNVLDEKIYQNKRGQHLMNYTLLYLFVYLVFVALIVNLG